jgi:hypothetical protein
MTQVPSELHRHPAPGQAGGDPAPARDLIDFHIRWREFRPFAQRVLARGDLAPREYETLRALVDLADRVRDHDLLA